MTNGIPSLQTVKLAQEPDVRIGNALIRPSACRIRIGEAEERIEPRVMEVIVVLLKAEGRTISRDELIEVCWGGRVVTDDALARTIAKVRQAGRLGDTPTFTIETTPKVGFRLLTAAKPEMAPSSAASAQHDPQPSQPPGRSPVLAAARRGKIDPRALLAGVAAVLAVAVLSLMVLRGAGSQPDLVEVMAFRPLRDDADLTALATRASDSMLRSLIAAGVASRTQVLQPDGGGNDRNASLRVLATLDEADGETILSGQIVDRQSGQILWSYVVTREDEARGGIDVQFGTAIAAVVACGARMRQEAERPLAPDSFSLFLQACGSVLIRQGDPRSITRKLVAAEPNLSIAHAFLALGYLSRMPEAGSAAEAAEWRKIVEDAASRAIRLDDRNAFGYIARSRAALERGDLVARGRDLERAIALDPDLAFGQLNQFEFLREVGRLREAAIFAQRMMGSDDPRSFAPTFVFVFAMAQDARWMKEALGKFEKIQPAGAPGVLATARLWWDESLAPSDVRKLAAGQMDERALRCWEVYLTRLRARGGRPIIGLPPECAAFSHDWRIRLLARQGDIDGAFALASEGSDPGRATPMYFFYPEMRRFRHDPRFMPLAKSLGLLDYWRTTGFWPDFCEEPDLPYACKSVAL